MAELDGLWVTPAELDPEFDPESMDPSDEALMREYEVALDACRFATQTLWALSGRKFHTGTAISEHYSVDRTHVSTMSVVPYYSSAIYDSSLGLYYVHPDDWRMRRIRLKGTPVTQVDTVVDTFTGQLINPEDYWIENRSVLRLRYEYPNGVEVSYTYGQRPPISGRRAAKALAIQFYYLWTDQDDKCSLPSRVTSVNRQGVSWVLLDNQDFLDELKTGVYAVDLFLRQVNPDKARLRPKVFSVDLPQGRRRS